MTIIDVFSTYTARRLETNYLKFRLQVVRGFLGNLDSVLLIL